MHYVEHVAKEFGPEYIFEIGDKAVTTCEMIVATGYFKKGTVVTITDISARGYDLMDEHGRYITEAGWDCVERIQ